MRVEIKLPDDKKFKEKLQKLADADGRSRKNWLEQIIICAVNTSSAYCECDNSMSSYLSKSGKLFICSDCNKPYSDKKEIIRKKQGGSNNA